MLIKTKTKIALAAALILGTASGALASQSGNDRGFQPQTWQDIARDRQDIQNQIHQLYHTSPGDAYGYAPSHHRVSHTR
jgi:hypothetical protein